MGFDAMRKMFSLWRIGASVVETSVVRTLTHEVPRSFLRMAALGISFACSFGFAKLPATL